MIILRALTLAWTDLLRPRIFSLALAGIGLTVLLLVALQAAVFWLIRIFASGSVMVPWIGTIDIGASLSWGSLALLPVMGFFLMAPVAAGFAGLFTDRVAAAVEDIHYPSEPGREIDFLDGLLESLAVVAAVIGVTIGTMLLTPLLGPLAPLVFYGANGWLLGREFFQMAARRHLDDAQATQMRRANSAVVTLAGTAIAVLLTVPLVNIVGPLLAAAGFTHLFHLIRGNTDQRIPAGRG